MTDLFDQIRAALRRNLYYAALFPTLALPDICAALESSDGQASPSRYIAWFDQWVSPAYSVLGKPPTLSGSDCYHFRCSLLHQGSTEHPKSSYRRIVFVEPAVSNVVMHNNIVSDALNLDVRLFCQDVIAGAEGWLQSARSQPNFVKNYPKFVARYPAGLAPYIVGVPVIA